MEEKEICLACLQKFKSSEFPLALKAAPELTQGLLFLARILEEGLQNELEPDALHYFADHSLRLLYLLELNFWYALTYLASLFSTQDFQTYWRKTVTLDETELYLTEKLLRQVANGIKILFRSRYQNSHVLSSGWSSAIKEVLIAFKIKKRLVGYGWPPRFMEQALELFQEQLQGLKGKKRQQQSKDLRRQFLTAGSRMNTALTYLWLDEKSADTEKKARNILRVLLKMLGAQLDSAGDLNLIKRFDPEMGPNAPFLPLLAKIVQSAFPKGLKERTDLARMIHQLRYFIDCSLVHYIRRKYPKAHTDRARLQLYDLYCIRHGLVPSNYEPARLHNKTENDHFISRGWNLKRVYRFHGEFILNRRGDFLYMDLWDKKNNTLEGIINTSSFNYANKNDKLHQLLDVRYDEKGTPYKDKKDPTLRKKLLKNKRSPTFNQRAELVNRYVYDLELKSRQWIRLENKRL